MSPPLVSCLCVTEGRPEFMSWLTWGFDRQSYPHKELVIVDSSSDRFVSDRGDVRVVGMAPGSNVPSKRNAALEHAKGSIIAWFDDDDWQHPERLERLVQGLAEGARFTGGSRSWFIDLYGQQCQPYDGRRAIIFNGAGFQADLARAVPFDEKIRKASDTVWMRELRGRAGESGKLLGPEPLTLWLCHDANISNPRKRRRFTQELEAARAHLGGAWGETDEKLAELRERLPAINAPAHAWQRARSRDGRVLELAEGRQDTRRIRGRSRSVTLSLRSAPEKDHVELVGPRPAPVAVAAGGRSRQGGKVLPDVSLLVRVGPQDVDCIHAAVSHLSGIRAWAECSVVLEPCAEPAEDARVLAKVDALVAAGHFARVISASSPLPLGVSGYLQQPERLATLGFSAGVAELLGVALASTPHVVLTSARVFFHASGRDWVSEALGKIQADSSLWLVAAHAGPPAGPAGSHRSSSWDAGTRTWDRRLGMWRSASVACGHGLVDRRRFEGQLTLLDTPPASLGEWLSSASGPQGRCGMLGGAESWAVAAREELPLKNWASLVARLVDSGRFPSNQRGHLLVDDDPRNSRAWLELAKTVLPDDAGRAPRRALDLAAAR